MMSESGYHYFVSRFRYFFDMVYKGLCKRTRTRDGPAVSMHEAF